MRSFTERGQSALVFLLVLAVLGIAALVLYGFNSRQNYELAQTVGENIADSLPGSTVTDIGESYWDAQYPNVVWTKAHADRHSGSVQLISSKCNEGTGNVQAHLKNPGTGRDAYVCFVEGFWVVTIKQFDPAKIEQFGDDVVTAFPNDSPTLQDVINYLIRGGYELL